jgi:hypothetical protein
MNRRGLLSGAAALSAYAALPKGARGQPSPPRGLSAARIRGMAPRHTRLSLGLNASDLALYTTPSISTLYGVVSVPDDCYAVRYAVANNNANAAWTITNSIFCPAPDVSAGYGNPTGGGAWTSFTWANAGADVETPFYLATTPVTFTVPLSTGAADPVTGATNIPKVYWSDFAPLGNNVWSSARGIKFLFYRILVPTASPVVRVTRPPDATWRGNTAVNNGMDWACNYFGGDKVTTPVTFAGDAFDGRCNPVYAWQFLCRTPGITVLSRGDSQMAGDATVSSMANFVTRTCLALNSPALPVLPWNSAWGGQPSATFSPVFRQNLLYARASIVVLQACSLNDNFATWYQELSRTMADAEAALATGAKVILINAFPRATATTSLALWTDIRARINAIGSNSGVVSVFDPTPILGNQSSPGVFDGTYLTGLSPDATHPNDAGHTAMQTGGFQALVASLIS